jgi:hypothetical protein
MLPLVAGAVLAAAICLPHVVRLDAAPPGFAAAIWLSALLLRALVSVAAVVAIQVYLPAAGLLEPLASACLAIGGSAVSAHALGDALLAIPALVLAGSLAWVSAGLWRAALRVRALPIVGPGPGGSVVVADGALLVAVAGLRRPRVVVSAGALVALDDEELLASLDHERGHIALRHRYLLVAGELARAVGRFVPGTRMVARELLFSLERDADRFALARRHDPAVLASAICKAARGAAAPTLALGGGVVTRRARLLLESGDAPGVPRAPVGLVALAPLMVTLAAVSAVALPFAAHAGYHERHLGTATARCSAMHPTADRVLASRVDVLRDRRLARRG